MTSGGSIPATPRAELARRQRDVLLRQLSRRSRPGERIEELLLDLGLLDESAFALELALTSGRRFEGLRSFVPDERLFLYVPVQLAVAERVCPLGLAGDTLALAGVYLDPALDFVQERFPNLEIELCVARRSELLAALRLVTNGL